MTAISTINLSVTRRIQGLLNVVRNLGFVVAGLMFLPSIADRRLLLVILLFFVANLLLAKGSRVAAVVLLLVAAGMAGYFENDYRSALSGVEAGPSGEAEGLDPSTERSMRSVIELSRSVAWFWVALCVIYLGALVAVAILHRRHPRPDPGRRRVALRAAILRARMTPKAMLCLGLAVACFLVAVGPWLVTALTLFLQVTPSGPLAFLRDWDSQVGWQQIALTFASAMCGLFLLTRAKRHAALSVERVRTLDPRRPNLLLRSFGDDMTPLERTADQHSWMRSVMVRTVWTLEETIEQFLGNYGPVIAIGRPGESVPPAGAAREYVPNDQWRGRVRALIDQAGVVVVVLGETEGLRFEYETLLEMGALGKLITVFPPHEPGALDSLWRRFAEVAIPDASTVDVSGALAAYFEADGAATIVTSRWRDDEDDYRLALEYCLAKGRRSASRPSGAGDIPGHP